MRGSTALEPLSCRGATEAHRTSTTKPRPDGRSPYAPRSVTLALAVILVGQWALALALGSPAPIGDEVDYLERSTRADPHEPGLFLRVPLFIELFVRARKLTGRPETATWFILSAGLAAAMGSAAAAHLAGLNALYVAASFLLAPEVLIFNRRYWPEPVLALSCAITTVLLWQYPDAHGVVFGLIVAISAAIRIEQLALIPGVAGAWLWAGVDRTVWDWSGLVLPSMACLGLWTLWCWHRYRIPWPDTTWQFNLEVARREAQHLRSAPVNVEQLVSAVRQDWASAGAASARRRPMRWNPGFMRISHRWMAMFGGETFISKRLLPPNGRGFPKAAWGQAGRLWLRYGFTTLVCLAVFFGVLSGRFEPYLTPTLALFVAVSSFHVRTRYRASLQPGLAIWLADGFSRVEFAGSWTPWVGLGLAMLLAVALGSIPFRDEA
jgi:hypothetical protein